MNLSLSEQPLSSITPQRQSSMQTPATSRHSASSVDRWSHVSAASAAPLLHSSAVQDSDRNVPDVQNQILRNCSTGRSPTLPIPQVQPTKTQLSSPQTPPCPLDTLASNASQRPPADPNQPSAAITVPKNVSCHEWKSWKIEWPYLTLLLATTSSLIISIASLLAYSQRHSGFARESDPPAFFARHPKLEKAIWEQGILYTALPAFVMTIYRTMWDSTVMAFADRQPYVDLKKPHGRNPRRTILLDYKAQPTLYRWVNAFRNGHYRLAGCMLSSLILSFFIVPLASFVFTMDDALLNSTVPLTFNTEYDPTRFAMPPLISSSPNVRLALDSAAALHLQNSSLPLWTDGNYAFPGFIPHVHTKNGRISVEVLAKGLDAQCKIFADSEYRKFIRGPPEAGSNYIIGIHAVDRGCEINYDLTVRTGPWSPTTFLTSWPTKSCSADAGYSRLSLLAAMYDKASSSVRNITLISCKTSYFSIPGILTAAVDPKFAPSNIEFTVDPKSPRHEQKESTSLKHWFEMYMSQFQCFNITSWVDGNEFVKYIYRRAAQISPEEALRPSSLADAMQALLQTTYAIFAATNLFLPRETPFSTTGTYTLEEKRLFVVESVSYIVLGVLCIIVMLNTSLFWYAKHKSILKEEPYGLLNAAGILYKSNLNNTIMQTIVDTGEDPGRARSVAKKLYDLQNVNFYWHDQEGKITADNLQLH